MYTTLWTAAQPVPCPNTHLPCPQPSDNHVTQNTNYKSKTLLINMIHYPGSMSV